MRTRIVVLIALLAVAVIASSCHEMTAQKYSVRADGTVLNSNGEPVRDLELRRGTVVRWCNETEFIIVIKTDGRILGGRETIRLRPGECIDRRVLSGAASSDYETHVVTEDGDEEGQGGGTIKVGEEDDGD